ncbi:MAG: Glu-tRNA(Gln) amidotransferase subunit GatE, partial [Candidatus Diapherotrites archaeon]|nr:Glu-tRNA(Gln) amidotransferase subunit GatE [Candidatus Diapherotrites archaeon]
MERTASNARYSLDRLGIPLIELSTDPDIRSPAQAKEVARFLGSLLRRTGRLRRGLGSIRQDLNVSIAGGERVELKGMQDLELMDVFVEREIQRQRALLELRDEMRLRGISADDFSGKMTDVSLVFSDSECRFLKGGNVFGVGLGKMKGLLGKEVQPDRRFGTELSGYVKVLCGLGIMHSDELPKFGVTQAEVDRVRGLLKCGENDAFILLGVKRADAGNASLLLPGKGKVAYAESVIRERCMAALEGVPRETRNALADGNSEFLRPVATSARMYPETDSLSIPIPAGRLKRIRSSLPLDEVQRKKLYVEKFRLSEKLADEMKLSNWARFFESLVAKGPNPTLVAAFLLEGLTQLRRSGINVDSLSNEQIEELLDAQSKGRMPAESLLPLTARWSESPRLSLDELLSMQGVVMVDEPLLRRRVQELLAEKKDLVKEKGLQSFAGLMGLVMAEFKGKADGKLISKVLSEELSKAVK